MNIGLYKRLNLYEITASLLELVVIFVYFNIKYS